MLHENSQLDLSDDFSFNKTLRMQVEAAFAERKGTDQFVDYEFKDYKGRSFVTVTCSRVFKHVILGTAHGFAARPNLSIAEVKEAYEQAFDQTVEWFEKTLAV
jgi:carboxymethylenebutenolidase